MPVSGAVADTQSVDPDRSISGPSTPAEVSVIFNENLKRWVAGRRLRRVVDRRRGY